MKMLAMFEMLAMPWRLPRTALNLRARKSQNVATAAYFVAATMPATPTVCCLKAAFCAGRSEIYISFELVAANAA